MKELTLFCVLGFIFTYTVGQFGLWDDFKNRAETVHNYEYKSLELSKEVRILRKQNEDLRAQITRINSEKEHLEMNLSDKGSQHRTIASIPSQNTSDLVNYELYKWSADKLLGVGEKALHFKKWNKSAQYYNALLKHYPKHESINDKTLFEAGIAAYESKQHYDWAQSHFTHLISRYPSSKYYRGAKLWLGLSHFYQGDSEKFVQTVDEFRKKYRNTKEWKVLSKYYEELNYKYKKQ
jgi:TolA-binding protein